MAVSKSKYRVQTMNFVVELEKDEELIQLARVDTIQKDTLVKILPDGSYVPAREVPILREVWGLDPKFETRPIESPNGAGTGLFKNSSVPPIPKKSELRLPSVDGPDVPPPPPAKPPRLETVVDSIPYFATLQQPPSEQEPLSSVHETFVTPSAANDVVLMDRSEESQRIYSFVDQASLLAEPPKAKDHDADNKNDAQHEDMLASLSREMDVVDAFRDVVDTPSVSLANDMIFCEDMDRISSDVASLSEEPPVRGDDETSILNRGRIDFLEHPQTELASDLLDMNDDELAAAEMTQETKAPDLSQLERATDDDDEDGATRTNWSDFDEADDRQTMETPMPVIPESILTAGRAKAKLVPNAVCEVADVPKTAGEEDKTQDLSVKANDIRIWTQQHIKREPVQHRNALESCRGLRSEDIALEDMKTNNVAVICEDEEVPTNELRWDSMVERAQTKPVIQRDVNRVIEEDRTTDRRKVDSSELRAIADGMAALAMRESELEREAASYSPQALSQSASEFVVVDPNKANAERIRAYQQESEMQRRERAENQVANAPAPVAVQPRRSAAAYAPVEPVAPTNTEPSRPAPAPAPAPMPQMTTPNGGLRSLSPNDLAAVRAAVDAAQRCIADRPISPTAEIIQNLSSLLDSIVKSQVDAVIEDADNGVERQYVNRVQPGGARDGVQIVQMRENAAPQTRNSVSEEVMLDGQTRPVMEPSRYSVTHQTCPGFRAPAEDESMRRSVRAVEPVVVNEDVDDSPSERFSVHNREDLQAMMRAQECVPQPVETRQSRIGKRDPSFDNLDDDVSMSEKLRVRKRQDYARILEAESRHPVSGVTPAMMKSMPEISPVQSGELRAIFEKENELNIFLENEARAGEYDGTGDGEVSRARKRISKSRRSSVNRALPQQVRPAEEQKVDERNRATQVGIPAERPENTEAQFNELLREGEKLVAQFGSLMLTNQRVWNVEHEKSGFKSFESYDLQSVQWYALRDDKRWGFILVDLFAVIGLAVLAALFHRPLLFVLLGYSVVMLPVCWFLSFKTTLQLGIGNMTIHSHVRVTNKNHRQAAKFLERLEHERSRNRRPYRERK